MKFNGTIFSKPQQDQLKEKIGNELEKVSAKVDEVDARMLNYKGDWITGDEYHDHDVVTFTDDGQLYEVIKAHTSSTSIKPGNTEYYKAMTIQATAQNHDIALNEIVNYHPTIIPDVVFIANLDNQDVVLRIENISQTSSGYEYTLASAFQFAKYGTNAVFVYSLIINTETNTKNCYKTSISGGSVSTVSVTVPSTIKACYNGKN